MVSQTREARWGFFDPSNVLGLKRSPCSLEVMTYFVACQCFCKSRSTLFVLIRCLYSANLDFPALFMQTPKSRMLHWESRSLGDAQYSNTPRLPPSALAGRLCSDSLRCSWLGLSTFSPSAVRIVRKQGQNIKSKVCATAEAIWAVLDRMLVGLFPC